MWDTIIIGAGISGCSLAMELSFYEMKILILESSSFPCAGATKANSATVHAGFDPSPGTKKAYYNVLGSKLYPEICNFLHVPYFKNGMIVFAKNDVQKQELYTLKDKADRNKVRANLLAHKELLRIEPDIPSSVLSGLYIPDSAMTSPFELAFSMADFAVLNGAVLKTSSPVRKIVRDVNGYKVTTESEIYFCKTIANCAGTSADIFHNMISEDKIHITPREGQHLVLDKCLAPYVRTTICQTPEPLPNGGHTKGMGMMPSTDGTILLGANAADIDDRGFTDTTFRGINQIISWFKDNWHCFPISNHVKEFPENSIITAYGGCRAHEDNDDFIVGEPEDAPGFFDIAGIESPGLTSAPAIAKDVASWIADYLQRKKKPSYMEPKHTIPFRRLSQNERISAINRDPDYADIICYCEEVTLADVLNAIHGRIPAHTLQSLKQRCHIGMGRCQGSRCTGRLLELLHRELHIPYEALRYSEDESLLFPVKAATGELF